MDQEMKALSLGPAAMEGACSLPPPEPVDEATCVSRDEWKISSETLEYLQARATAQFNAFVELVFLLKKEFPVFQVIRAVDLGDGYLRVLFGKDGKSESTFTVDVHCPRFDPEADTVAWIRLYSLHEASLNVSVVRANFKELEEAIRRAKAVRNIV